MNITTRRLLGTPVEAGDGVVGKVDDVYFDVRTGDVTHVSVALTGWYRGSIVLVPVDTCSFLYANHRIVLHNMSAEEVRQFPLLDDTSARYLENTQLAAMYQDTAPCWSFSGRCCVTSTRSESVEKTTGQPALWSSRDLMKAPVSYGPDTKLGRVKDLVLDLETWRVTHVIIRQGRWFRHESIAMSMANILEVEGLAAAARLVLSRPASRLAA